MSDFNVEDELIYLDRLNVLIDKWSISEKSAITKNETKFRELSVFNFKTIYSTGSNAQAMRKYFFMNSTSTSSEDFLFSRILDLYVIISMELPEDFIERQRTSHIQKLKLLGYEVDSKVVASLPYGWLLPRLQFSIRYH